MPRTKKKDNIKKTKDDIKKENIKKTKDNSKYVIPFYTKERWQNWIDKAKEINFNIVDQDKCTVFIYMIDDVILACLKIISKYDKGLLQKDDADKYLSEIKDIVLKKIEPINEDTDMMLESTQLSLMGVFVSCECYMGKTFERTKSFGNLINDAIRAEEKNDMGLALELVATIGANIIAGEKLNESDLDNISSEGLIPEWLDGIDSLSVAMMGDTSYRDDEPDSGD